MKITPYLPGKDPEPERRRWGIDAMKAMYEYDYDTLSPIPIIARVPARDYFSPEYKGKSDRMQMEGGRALAAGTLASQQKDADILGEFDRLVAPFNRPAMMRGHLMDRMFAEQRLAGVNPMKIERLREIPAEFPFTDAHLATAYEKSRKRRIEDECAGGRLFVADYRYMEDIPSGSFEGGAKFLPAPLVLFCWRESAFGHRGELVPIGISVRSGVNAESRVLTPRCNPLHWNLAKLAVQIADGNHHQMSSHLARTHFVMEPFAIATPRHLSYCHPIFLLLRPHLRFMLAQNSYGRIVLMTPGRVVDRLLGASLDGSFSLIAKAYESWSFDKFNLPAELEIRGVGPDETLPHYPYREDAILIWDAVERFVSSYLKLYYLEDSADIEADEELQDWARELCSRDGGRVKGFPESIRTLSELTTILTTVIFTCGPQHAAVNFPQFDYMAHVPNMPLAAYAELPLDDSTEQETWRKVLPPRDRAIEQIQITFSLTTFRHDRLGHYLDTDFEDERAMECAHRFRQDLYDAEAIIESRNETRVLPYPYLQPSLIPNSIAI